MRNVISSIFCGHGNREMSSP